MTQILPIKFQEHLQVSEQEDSGGELGDPALPLWGLDLEFSSPAFKLTLAQNKLPCRATRDSQTVLPSLPPNEFNIAPGL